MNDPKDLINWAELSRLLTGDNTRISRTRCPKKYRAEVDSLIESVKKWDKGK